MRRSRIFLGYGESKPQRRDRLRGAASMWKRAAVYGSALAAGTFALQWLDYQRLARALGRGVRLSGRGRFSRPRDLPRGAAVRCDRPGRIRWQPEGPGQPRHHTARACGAAAARGWTLEQARSRPSSMCPRTPSRPTLRGCSRSSTRPGARRRSTGRASSGSCRERRRFGVIGAKSPLWRMAAGRGAVANGRTIG